VCVPFDVERANIAHQTTAGETPTLLDQADVLIGYLERRSDLFLGPPERFAPSLEVGADTPQILAAQCGEKSLIESLPSPAHRAALPSTTKVLRSGTGHPCASICDPLG
jgi:hypothetical protein